MLMIAGDLRGRHEGTQRWWRGKSTARCSTRHLESPSLTTRTRQHQQLMDGSYLSLYADMRVPLHALLIFTTRAPIKGQCHKSSIVPTEREREREDVESGQPTIGQQYHTNCLHVTRFLLIHNDDVGKVTHTYQCLLTLIKGIYSNSAKINETGMKHSSSFLHMLVKWHFPADFLTRVLKILSLKVRWWFHEDP